MNFSFKWFSNKSHFVMTLKKKDRKKNPTKNRYEIKNARKKNTSTWKRNLLFGFMIWWIFRACDHTLILYSHVSRCELYSCRFLLLSRALRHSMSNKINNDEKHRITCARAINSPQRFWNSFDFISEIYVDISFPRVSRSLARSRNFLKAFWSCGDCSMSILGRMNPTHFFGQSNRLFHSLMKYVCFSQTLIAIGWILCKWNICMKKKR